MKHVNEPVVITRGDDDPQAVIDETRDEVSAAFGQQRTGIMGLINRLFGGTKQIDEMQAEVNADLDEMQQDLKRHGL